MLMSRLPVPIVTIVTGEGGSGGALALGRRRPGADAGELLLLGDQPRGLRDDPVQGRGRRRRGRPRRCASPRPTCCGSGSWTPSCPSPQAGAHTDHDADRRQRQDGDRRRACGSCSPLSPDELLAEALRALPRVRRARPPSRYFRRSEEDRMTDDKKHDRVRRLGRGAGSGAAARGHERAALRRQGAATTKIEIERGATVPACRGGCAGAVSGRSPTAPRPARASPRGARRLGRIRRRRGPEVDNRMPVLAPLVGTFYRASAARREAVRRGGRRRRARARRSASSRR